VFNEKNVAMEVVRRTYKGHKKRYPAMEFVQSEWAIHRDAYKKNKSAFTLHYVKRVFNEFDVTITEKKMREVWLKDTPTASKQAG